MYGMIAEREDRGPGEAAAQGVVEAEEAGGAPSSG